MAMTSYERVMMALQREEPDRVPIFEFMIDPKVIDGILPGGSYPDLVEALDIDCVVTPTPSRMYNLHVVDELADGTPIYQSDWGERRAANVEMVTIPVQHPVKSHADWEAYQVPDPERPERLTDLRMLVSRFKGRRAIGFHTHDSFNYPSYVFGMTELFLNLIEEPEWVQEVVDACNAHCVRLVELAVQAGADFIMLGDDLGGKAGPMMSPRHYRQFFLPGLVRVVEKVHALGARVIKHSDGNVTRLLDMFVEAQIDGFHPSDPAAGMDIAEVKRHYGDRFAVCGGIDTGEQLSWWSVPQLVAEVRRRIDQLAPGGGWMIASSNTVHSSVRPENYQALVRAIQTYGNYGRLNEPISSDLEASIGQVPLRPRPSASVPPA